jgi:hypothetical protein
MLSANKKRKLEEEPIFNINGSLNLKNKRINNRIYKIINNFENELLEYLLSDEVDNYINSDRIEEKIKDNNNNIIQIISNDIGEMKNRCIECNIDMGQCNPRQLCKKVYCDNELYTLTIKCSICKIQLENNNKVTTLSNDILICRDCLIDKS